MIDFNKTLYNELILRKENGEKLNLSDLEESKFIQLWYRENIPLYKIANLFEVPEHRIKKLKNSWGLTKEKLLSRRLNEELMRAYADMKNIDNIIAMKEIERARNKVELTVGYRYDNAFDCFKENESLIWDNPSYEDLVNAFKLLFKKKIDF